MDVHVTLRLPGDEPPTSEDVAAACDFFAWCLRDRPAQMTSSLEVVFDLRHLSFIPA